jgi:hypothetical protein
VLRSGAVSTSARNLSPALVLAELCLLFWLLYSIFSFCSELPPSLCSENRTMTAGEIVTVAYNPNMLVPWYHPHVGGHSQWPTSSVPWYLFEDLQT